ncbi:MAG: single-stranded-DNA-specific exonuclease RecJ, partial [Nitrospirae bacterium]
LALKELGADVHYYIPDRFSDGYGFGQGGLDYAREISASLIITVDCGITSFDSVRKARKMGMAVIVTDHHEPKRDEQGALLLPEADVVINPRLQEEMPPMSGVMVAFKLAEALLGRERAVRMLDLVSLGTVADIIPLVDEGRVVVKEGLRLINSAERPGIKSLIEVSGLRPGNITAGLLGFTLIPRINASGRIDNARDVIRMLTTTEHAEAVEIAGRLNELNQKRQQIEEEVLNEAREDVERRGFEYAIVSASEGWHEGVVGIVAARLAERFYRPAFVFNISDGYARGSARSIPPLNLYRAIARCADLLEAFGGHRQAAGLKLRVERLPEFEARINQTVREMLSDEDLIPTLTIDAQVTLRDISFELIKELQGLEPFGAGNPEPVFGAKALEVLNARVVGNNHLKMSLRDRNVVIDAIGFDMAERFEPIASNGTVDVVFSPQVNEWEGGRYLQLRLMTMRPSKNKG